MEYETKYIDENKWRVELEALTQEYERMLAFIEQELKTAPEGSLVVKNKNGKWEYYWNKKTGRNYLSIKQKGLISKLVQKRYNEKARAILRKQIKKNQGILKLKVEPTLQSIMKQMTFARGEWVKPLVTSIDDYAERWSKVPYDPKPFSEGDPEHYAKNGLRVRSKSEAIIVDFLLEYGIVFRYECPLYLKGLGQIHPDFIVINKRTGEEIVWEHFGKMDDWKYANDMVKRVEAYHYNGFYEGKNFIYTLESTRQPFGARDAKRMIEQYLI